MANTTPFRQPPGPTLDGTLTALFTALKVLSFYPAEHPRCEESVAAAHDQLLVFLGGEELVLQICRNGITTADEPQRLVANQSALSLAKELLVRKVQQLVFLPELSRRDLRLFLEVLAVEPQGIAAAGGLPPRMAKERIETIFANELVLSASKRKIPDTGQAAARQAGIGNDLEALLPAAPAEPAEPDDSLQSLTEALVAETDDLRSQQLARWVAAKAQALKNEGGLTEIVSPLAALLRHLNDVRTTTTRRESALFALEQMADGKMTQFLIDQLEQREGDGKEVLLQLCPHLGHALAFPLIQRLAEAQTLLARKALTLAMVRIGEPAIPALTSALHDERWYVVRNIAAILGEISVPSCLPHLGQAARHREPKVRKESIRAIMKIGGQEAEELIVSLLADPQQEIVKQAIHSLGIMKSRCAVPHLLAIVGSRNLFLSSLPLKKEAVLALGRIGDRRATPRLLQLLETRACLARRKWQELKVATAAALGQLGDESALPLLQNLAKCQNTIGSACGEAVAAMEKPAK